MLSRMTKMGRGHNTVTTERTGSELPDAPSFSVRLTEEQREVITKAAAVKGWKPAQLLRVAGYERAVHILNTTAESQVDFRGLARKIADLVSGEPVVYVGGDYGKVRASVVDDVGALGPPTDGPPVEINPSPLQGAELDALRDAARFGGAEFLALIVEACDALRKRSRGELPPPIDPSIQ
jgi:hypothetical protein